MISSPLGFKTPSAQSPLHSRRASLSALLSRKASRRRKAQSRRSALVRPLIRGSGTSRISTAGGRAGRAGGTLTGAGSRERQRGKEHQPKSELADHWHIPH